MKYSIVNKECLDILLDKDEAIILIGLLEGKDISSEFKASIAWHLKTFVKNVKGE